MIHAALVLAAVAGLLTLAGFISADIYARLTEGSRP